jgi:F-type H+-transporting ATPase subunit b
MHEESFFGNPRTWVAVAFIIFVVLFGRKLWGAFAGILDKRIAAVRAELDEAQRLRGEAEQLLAEAKSRREAAMTEAQALLAGAKAEAERLAHEAEADAKAATVRRERMAVDRIAAAEKAAVAEVRETAAEVAVTAAETVIRDHLSQEMDAGLVDRAINGLPAALSPRRAA